MAAFLSIFSSFVLGLLTPLTAVCVLPLYPGFLAYLSNALANRSDDRKLTVLFGVIIVSGVLLFMFILGLLFTTILQISLTKVINIVSPIAFSILGIISILLILDLDFGRIFPKVHAPIVKNPLLSALIFGFFFGAIVIPCNPAFIAILFTKTALTATDFISNMLNFLFFGLGIGFPLLLFSVLSATLSQKIIGVLVNHKSIINRISGVFMLIVALYYLIFVFRVFGG